MGENLDGSIQEVKLWDAHCEEAQKYFKLGANIKAFDKNGKDVNDRVLEAITKGLKKTELEKLSHIS